MAGDMPRWRAAADRLPALAARTKTRMLVTRSIPFPTISHKCQSILACSPAHSGQPYWQPKELEGVSMHGQQHTRQPTLFIPQGGGPCFFMDWSPADTWADMGRFLRGLA